jgi:hypothetical protein
MISRSLALILFAAGCLTAAAGGSYLAVRQNAAAQPPTTAPVATPSTPAVHESEGVVTPREQPRSAPAPLEAPAVQAAPLAPAVEDKAPARVPPAAAERRVFPRSQPARRPAPVRISSDPASPAASEPRVIDAPPSTVATATATADMPERPAPTEAAAGSARPAEPVFDEIVIPASSVIGLELETTVTSERAQVEDRVDARVTRDVYADGRLAIPAGSRVAGAVTMVERGGKVKERARLGVRFHTLVLANGRQVALRTETIYREGESPANESSRKIGGAAVGGAVLGAILGGGKGAIAGATAGAAGGTAAVMAGGRNAATLASGSILTVKLAAPVSFDVER